jgi:hypothetical protein
MHDGGAAISSVEIGIAEQERERDAAAPLMREALCSARCCICGPWGVLSHRTLSWKSHVTARFVIIKYTQSGSVRALLSSIMCRGCNPCGDGEFRFFDNVLAHCSREELWEWLSERARRTFVTKSWEWVRESVCANEAGGPPLNICTRFLACCCCPWLLVHFQRPQWASSSNKLFLNHD